MKKFKKIMAVLVAAMMIMAMAVPAWAATSQTNSGAIYAATPTKGKITIKNVKDGEIYTIYKLFDLASYEDSNPAAGQHDTDHYSYVISESSAVSPWYSFLTTQPASGNTYAKVGAADQANETTNQMFWIEPAPITIGSVNNYHVITATSHFPNRNDILDSTYKTTDYVSDANAKIAQEFAQALADYAEGSGSTAVAGSIVTGTPKKATSTEDLVFDDLPLGYYLITSSLGSLCALDTTNNQVVMFDKNDVASLEKKVLKKDGTATTPTHWVDERDANIGDTINYKITVGTNQGAENLVIHDKMEDGLTFNDSSVAITLTRKNTTTPITIPESYTSSGGSTVTTTNWSLDTSPTSGCSFEISFLPNYPTDKAFKDANGNDYDIKDGDTITVTYTATLNNRAIIYENTDTASAQDLTLINTNNVTIPSWYSGSNGDKRNTNAAILTYGGGSFTAWSDVDVTTYQFDAVKVKATDAENEMLADAKFSLYRMDSAGTSKVTIGNTDYKYDAAKPLKFTVKSDNKYEYADYTSSTETNTVITSKAGANLEMNMYGLASDTYILVEDVAPYGYNKLAYPIVITISDSSATTNEGKITILSKDNNNTEATSSNVAWNATVAKPDDKNYYTHDGTSGGVKIVNYTAAEMPNTGGMGTTVLYIVGGMLVILAGAYLFFSRKKTA